MNTDELMGRINARIDNMPANQVKDDMRLLITSLIKFTNDQDDRILDPKTLSEDLPGLFFKLVVNLGTEAAVAQLSKKQRSRFEEKINSLMVLWPMLQEYSNIHDTNDTHFEEVKNELPPGKENLLGDGNTE